MLKVINVWSIENISNVKELGGEFQKNPFFKIGRCHLMMIHNVVWIIALATMHLGQCLTRVVCCVSSQLDGTNVMENYCCSRIHDNNDLMERDSKIDSLLIHTTSSSSSWEVNVNLLPPFPSFVYFIKVVFYGVVFFYYDFPIVVGDCFQYTFHFIYSHIAIHY